MDTLMILWFLTLMTSILSKKMEDHEHHVCLVLENLLKVGFYPKSEKCELHQSQVQVLGYDIFGNGTCMDLHKVLTIFYWAISAFV